MKYFISANNSFGEQTERILHGWKLSVQSSGSPSWNKSVGNLKFGDSEFRLTRHWKSGICEERGSGNDNQGAFGAFQFLGLF